MSNVQRTAMVDKDHLIRWLQASDRTFMVLNAKDLVNGMCVSYGWPEGGRIIQDMIARYRAERSKDVDTDGDVQVVRTDELTLQELDGAVRQLVAQISALGTEEAKAWKLESLPL